MASSANRVTKQDEPGVSQRVCTDGTGQKCPAAHLSSASLPSGQWLPAPHATGSVVPTLGHELPAGQGVSSALPSAQNEPLPHCSFVLASLQCHPAGQRPSLVLPAAQYAPADAHGCFSDGVGQACPSGHSPSASLPSWQKLPLRHATGVVVPALGQ